MHFSLGGKQKGKKKEKKRKQQSCVSRSGSGLRGKPLPPRCSLIWLIFTPLVQLPPAGVGGEVGAHSQGARPHL